MDTYSKAERNYKNNVFVDYIGTKERLIEVYNAVRGTNYTNDTRVEINTLKNVLYRFIQNDISFVIDDKLVVLIEHQSTINENMPIRMFEYIAKIYEKMIPGDAYYRKNKIMLLRPEFIVFYNGKEAYDEKKQLKLSESYADGGGGESLVLTVNVYNINEGMNRDVLDRSRSLWEYVTLVSKLREYEKAGYPLEKAVDDAVKYCVENDIMVEYLRVHGSEVMSILVHEYSYDDELRVAKEEGMERGLAAGRVERDVEVVQRMRAEKFDAALISRITGLSEAEIEKI
jgi:hypothetical protein